jgi:hypothetical protein
MNYTAGRAAQSAGRAGFLGGKPTFQGSKKIPCTKRIICAVQSPHEFHTRIPWPEIFSLLAAIAGRTSPSLLPIRRFSRNVAIRRRSGVSLVVRPRKMMEVEGDQVTVPLLQRELLSFVRVAASRLRFLLSLGVTGRCFAAIATRRERAARVAPAVEPHAAVRVTRSPRGLSPNTLPSLNWRYTCAPGRSTVA